MSRLFRKKEERASLWQRMKDVALMDVSVLLRGLDDDSLERLEDLLIASDFGVPATLRLVETVQRMAERAEIRTEKDMRNAVIHEIDAILSSGEADGGLRFAAGQGPTVYLMVGVNGVGKTTTIGKLSHKLSGEGHRVLMAAADTFRAGATDQLRVWAERTGAEFVGARPGADPASVAFDAIEAARTRGADVVIVDTAGRLHTQSDLMAELAKVERVIARRVDGAPHETLLVLDATVGQNALMQVRMFSEALRLTGLVLAKLDSTARGGIIVALKEEFGLPVKLVGTGETVDAIEAFDSRRFAEEILAA